MFNLGKSKSDQTTEQGQGGPTTDEKTENGPPQETGDQGEETKPLAELSDDDIKNMKKIPLQALCRKEQLSPSGNKDELVDRLMLKKYGRSDRYYNTMTKCRICSSAVSVNGKKTEPMKDGRILVTRQIKCKGKHHHTYPLKDIIERE